MPPFPAQLADNAAAVDAARRGQAVVDALNARVDALAEDNSRLAAELSGARAAARTEMLSLQQLADERARVAAGLQSDLEAALAALGSSGGGRGGDHGYGHDQGRAQQHSLLAGARGGGAAAAGGGGADDSALQSAAAPEATARSQARRRRILMGGDGASSGTTAGKPVLPPALPGGSGPGRPGPPSAPAPGAAPAVSGSVVQLQLQAESLARRLTQEQATVAALQAEQREVLAVNERLRRALLDAGMGSSSSHAAATAFDDDEGGAVAPPPLHVLARAFWLRLRQGERTCGAVRRLVTSVHATLVAAHELLAGAGGGAALEAAQRLLDGYAQAGQGGADGGGAPLFRCVVLPHTDTHGALGAGACGAAAAAAAAACPLSLPHTPSLPLSLPAPYPGASAALTASSEGLGLGPAASLCDWTDLPRLDADLDALADDAAKLRQAAAAASSSAGGRAGAGGRHGHHSLAAPDGHADSDACAMQ